jgi:hypothetical protein
MKMSAFWHKADMSALSGMCSRRIKPMTESATELYDEKVLNDELPDAALEIAGSKWGDGAAASVTAAFAQDWTAAHPLPRNKNTPVIRRPRFIRGLDGKQRRFGAGKLV